MLTVTSKMTILAREVRGYVTVSRDMRGTPEQRSGSVLMAVTSYCFDESYYIVWI